jgi:hypothetical protein
VAASKLTNSPGILYWAPDSARVAFWKNGVYNSVDLGRISLQDAQKESWLRGLRLVVGKGELQ